MGLAPYGTEHHGKRSLEFFRTINRVSGIEIVNDELVPELYYTVRDALEGERFDGIAWGLQTWLEEILCEWVTNCTQHFGVDSVVLSGGVAQNIKALQAIAELPNVKNLWAGPVSGDGSLAVGAAWLASRKLMPEVEIKTFPTVYLGTEYCADEVAKAINRNRLQADSTNRIPSRPLPPWKR